MTDQADQPDKRPISPLRQRMLEDMAMHDLREVTQRDYLRFVRSFAAFLRRPPDTATPEDIRRFQITSSAPRGFVHGRFPYAGLVPHHRSDGRCPETFTEAVFQPPVPAAPKRTSR